MRTSAGWLVLGLAVVLRAGSLSHAYFLDQGRHFDLRVRAYSQFGPLVLQAAEGLPRALEWFASY